jgi:hypothetical protein
MPFLCALYDWLCAVWFFDLAIWNPLLPSTSANKQTANQREGRVGLAYKRNMITYEKIEQGRWRVTEASARGGEEGDEWSGGG